MYQVKEVSQLSEVNNNMNLNRNINESQQNTPLLNNGVQQPITASYTWSPEPPEKTMYDTKVKENFHIYGIASLIYACLYAFCMYKNDAGVTYLIFIAGSIIFICFCLQKLEVKLKNESIFYFISMLLLSISTFCTDDGRIIFFNKLGVFLLTISMLLGAVYDTKKWNLGKYLGSICQVCVMAVGEVVRPFSDAVWYCKNKLDKKNSKYLYVLLGLVITVPLFIVVFALLVSADAVFRDMASQMFADWSMADLFWICFMIGFMFLASYGILTFLCRKTLKEEVTDSRKWEPLIAIPIATIMSALYLVFSVIQIVYLFIGNMQLPEGYTYAEYAREGFFQLLAVSILNLIMVLIGLYFFKPSKGLKGILIVMSACTFIMIASSAMRMIIYIQYYYLTFLRILVLWTLVVLALVFIGVIIYTVKENFPLFRYSMVIVTCLYLGLSFSHPDYWIAKVNVAGTEEDRSDFFKGEAYDDYYFLSQLNADAAPVMVEWIEKEGHDLNYYFSSENYTDTFKMSNEEYCAWQYLTSLRGRVGEIGFLNFNTSRYIADYEVLSRVIEGM